MKKFTATAPDGTIVTRKSNREYAYAIIAKDVHSGQWMASWSSRLDLAMKQADKDRSLTSYWSEVVVVEVVAA